MVTQQQDLTADGADEAEQLDLGADEEHLPWLESDDDYEEPGVDTARIAAFGIIGLLVIALIVGGIWWFTRNGGPGPAANGGVIAAPQGPYKTKPANPGGKTFQGTGDESFAVAEGESRDGRLASDDTPKPSVDAATVENTTAAAKEAKEASSGVVVQVGAYSTHASAATGWQRLVNQFAVLKGVNHRIVEGQADIGTVYRLQAIAPDLAAANHLCSQLKASGGACQVKP